MLLAWMATGLAVFCIFWPLEKLGMVGPHQLDGVISIGEWISDRLAVIWFLFSVPALVVWVYCRMARRAALGWPWIGVAACIVALTVGCIRSGFPDPALQPRASDGSELPVDMHMLTLGLPIFATKSATPAVLLRFTWNWYTQDREQACQLLLPLIVAICVLLRLHQLSFQAAERLVPDGS